MDSMTLKNRKSIRKYDQNRSISNQLLNQLIESAIRVSTTGNMQLYSVIVTRDTEMKEKLSPMHFNQPMIKEAPIVLTFCADFNRFTKWCEFRDANPSYNNFQSFLAAMIDTSIFAQQFCTAAEESGLGICYIGTTTYNADKIIDALNLPKLVMPITTITLGYPADMEHPMVDRLPIEGIIHNEAYCDYNKELIDEIYANKESLEENKRFIADNNKTTLAQVFTDIRYNKANNEHFSNVFLNTLKSQGFID